MDIRNIKIRIKNFPFKGEHEVYYKGVKLGSLYEIERDGDFVRYQFQPTREIFGKYKLGGFSNVASLKEAKEILASKIEQIEQNKPIQHKPKGKAKLLGTFKEGEELAFMMKHTQALSSNFGEDAVVYQGYEKDYDGQGEYYYRMLFIDPPYVSAYSKKIYPKKYAKELKAEDEMPSLDELLTIHMQRTRRAKLADEAQEHSTVINHDSPRVYQWMKDPSSKDIRGIDTPRKSVKKNKRKQKNGTTPSIKRAK